MPAELRVTANILTQVSDLSCNGIRIRPQRESQVFFRQPPALQSTGSVARICIFLSATWLEEVSVMLLWDCNNLSQLLKMLSEIIITKSNHSLIYFFFLNLASLGMSKDFSQ